MLASASTPDRTIPLTMAPASSVSVSFFRSSVEPASILSARARLTAITGRAALPDPDSYESFGSSSS